MKHIFCILIAAFTLCSCSNDDQESAPKYKNPILEIEKKGYIESIINGNDTLIMNGSSVPRATHISYGKGINTPNNVVWQYRQKLKSGQQLQCSVALANPSIGALLIDSYDSFTTNELKYLSTSKIYIYDENGHRTAIYIPSKENPLALGINICIKLYRGELTYYWLEGYLEGTYYNKENPKDAITVKLKFGFI